MPMMRVVLRNEDNIPTSIDRDPRGFFRVTPASPVPAGEHGFSLASGLGAGPGKIYDLGVD